MPRVKIIGAVCLLAAVLAACSSAIDARDGDIIFQRSQSKQAQAIAAATHSDYTHTGIIFIEEGKPFVYEAVQPVIRTPIAEWIARGDRRHYVIKRLKDPSALDAPPLKREVVSMLGKDYDWLFEWTDDKIYCSELVWKAYRRGLGIELGRPRTLKDFDLSHPAVQQLMRERYGANIPFAMQVVAPSDLFDSPLLVTVSEK